MSNASGTSVCGGAGKGMSGFCTAGRAMPHPLFSHEDLACSRATCGELGARWHIGQCAGRGMCGAECGDQVYGLVAPSTAIGAAIRPAPAPAGFRPQTSPSASDCRLSHRLLQAPPGLPGGIGPAQTVRRSENRRKVTPGGFFSAYSYQACSTHQ